MGIVQNDLTWFFIRAEDHLSEDFQPFYWKTVILVAIKWKVDKMAG